jgi:hypothetical protein
MDKKKKPKIPCSFFFHNGDYRQKEDIMSLVQTQVVMTQPRNASTLLWLN